MILAANDAEQFVPLQLITTSPVTLLTNVKLDELKAINVTLMLGELQLPVKSEVAVTFTGELTQPKDPAAGRFSVTQLPAATQPDDPGAELSPLGQSIHFPKMRMRHGCQLKTNDLSPPELNFPAVH